MSCLHFVDINQPAGTARVRKRHQPCPQALQPASLSHSLITQSPTQSLIHSLSHSLTGSLSHSLPSLPSCTGWLLANAAAALVGGVGIVGGVNYNEHFVLAEPIHGTGPHLVGENRANPTASIRAVGMLLQVRGGQGVHRGRGAASPMCRRSRPAALSQKIRGSGTIRSSGSGSSSRSQRVP